MPNTITQLVIGTAFALAVICVVGSAPAVGQTQILVNRDEPSLLSETNVRLDDHQQLRKLFLDESSGRLR